MSETPISTKGQIVLPVAAREALGLKPGMRVNVKLEEIQSLLKYSGPTVPIGHMRVTNYKG